MESFTQMSNHMVSHSGSAINTGDDMSTLDPDESYMNTAAAARRRRHDDDDETSDGLDDDDLESLASVQVGEHMKSRVAVEAEKELPPHACAYVYRPS